MSITGSKPLASLSSGLLARKGQARPAMRPQGYGGFGAIPGQQDDLGWNDMGHDEPHPPHVAAVPPVLRQLEQLQEEFAPQVPQAYEPTVEPQVEASQEVEDYEEEYEPEQEGTYAPLTASVAHAEPVVEAPVPHAEVVRPVSVATASRLDRETAAKTKRGKAAFTLRLDHDRHLRLRIASALCHRSAQILVTEALDAFLNSLPEVGALVSQLPPPKARR
ncbi:MAG: hypothetical protein JWL96_3010 [Sphingomonas bacterium]|uniref:hypothetical protein n=1 Tax=Sphingomonas bacterium TaxID=1895847 RepID=UPI00262E8162|nr:hypothetical protein [Sphingomonas bacterium]MDB5710940.1 hypothetical protein [Sphingomonas bacterium]